MYASCMNVWEKQITYQYTIKLYHTQLLEKMQSVITQKELPASYNINGLREECKDDKRGDEPGLGDQQSKSYLCEKST